MLRDQLYCCLHRLLEDLKAEDSETAEELEQQLGRLKQEFQQLYSCMVDEQRQGPRHATAWERERAVARRARALQSMQQQVCFKLPGGSGDA